MSDQAEWDLNKLPRWAQVAFQSASASPQPALSAVAHRGTAAWPLLIEAAVVSSFLPRDLAPGEAEGEARRDAESVVLGFAETAHDPDGVKWSLKREARAEVVQATLDTEELQRAIKRTQSRFVDPISEALRDCLTQRADAIAVLSLKSPDATRIAVSSLSGVSGLNLPDLDDLDREIEFRRLLAHFERMIGQRADQADPQDGAHRFFGRGEEMERLRDYVGVIRADSTLQWAKRIGRFVSRAIQGRAPMMVWGVGGVGKTTLISKFMLEHAKAAVSRFPFAYLDFDRTTVSARRRAGLLAEMCLQTGSQFKELSGPMAALRAEVLQLAHSLETTDEFENISLIAPYAVKFRQLIDDHLASLESLFEWARPFLLVFDTFEVVQYSDENVTDLEEFIRGFSNEGESGMWPRMRLIISGRKKVTSFLGTVEELQLGALDAEGSAEMLLALARDANKTITRADAKKLAAAVAKATREPTGGVQPLRLRLIGELFRNTKESGRAIVTSLTKELNRPLKSKGLAAQVLIDGVLIRRVLSHIVDPRVKALADPGLVVRRITPEVIKDVMTRGTSNPSSGEAEDADTFAVEPWVIDDAEARSIFDAFRREVTLVESDGDALRHRPDVRQQMLPLIRVRRPKRFESLNRLAFDYFRTRAKSDGAAAAEAVYHGLWLNEPLTDLNLLWREEPGLRPRIDAEEFDSGSPANIFVRAKGRAALAADEVSKLPREVALDWLDKRSADLLEERRIEDAIQAIRTAAGDNYEALDERAGTAAVLARLLYRAGLWDDAARLAARHIDRANYQELAAGEVEEGVPQGEGEGLYLDALLSLTRTWVTIVCKGGGSEQEIERACALAYPPLEPLSRVEIAAHALIRLAQPGWLGGGHSDKLRALILNSISSIKRPVWKREQRVLRLAMLSGGLLPELLEVWVESRERVPRDTPVIAINDLLEHVFGEGPSAAGVKGIVLEPAQQPKSESLDKLDDFWRRKKAIVLDAVRTRADLRHKFWPLVAYDHSDWVRPLGNALTRALKENYGEDLGPWLGREGYRAGRGNRRQQRDGIGVVQSAADDGRLLELAKALGTWDASSSKGQEGVEARSHYPQDVFTIGRALLRWHKTIVEVL